MKTMSLAEFATLFKHIQEEHSPKTMPHLVKCVKYIDPHFDMRTNTVFAIGFRGYGWDKVLHTQNEYRDLPDSLYTRCMNFLDNKGEKHDTH